MKLKVEELRHYFLILTIFLIFTFAYFSPDKTSQGLSSKSLELNADVPEKIVTNSYDSNTYFYANSEIIASKSNEELVYSYNDRMGTSRINSLNSKSKFLPFGQQIDSDSSFTAKEFDYSRLYYFNARYYDPNLGKFISVDKLEGSYPYEFVHNSPTNFIDPSGNNFVLLSVPSILNIVNHLQNVLLTETRQPEVSKSITEELFKYSELLKKEKLPTKNFDQEKTQSINPNSVRFIVDNINSEVGINVLKVKGDPKNAQVSLDGSSLWAFTITAAGMEADKQFGSPVANALEKYDEVTLEVPGGKLSPGANGLKYSRDNAEITYSPFINKFEGGYRALGFEFKLSLDKEDSRVSLVYKRTW